MRKISHKMFLFLFFILSGFLAGIILPELFRMSSGSYAGLFSLYSLQLFEQQEIRSWDIFQYLLSGRMEMLLFLWMSSFSAAGIVFHMIYFWWLALSAGILLGLCVLRIGYQGILLFGCCLLPQWILYAFMWKKELQKNSSDTMTAVLKKTGELMGLCLAGCACEAFIGVRISKIFLRIFQ